jgi:hypothetical protein
LKTKGFWKRAVLEIVVRLHIQAHKCTHSSAGIRRGHQEDNGAEADEGHWTARIHSTSTRPAWLSALTMSEKEFFSDLEAGLSYPFL